MRNNSWTSVITCPVRINERCRISGQKYEKGENPLKIQDHVNLPSEPYFCKPAPYLLRRENNPVRNHIFIEGASLFKITPVLNCCLIGLERHEINKSHRLFLR